MNLFKVKPLERILAESEQVGEHSLKRTLGSVQLVALGIGAIIGAGLFSLTGIAAAENAGPAVVLAFVLAATGCAFAGMCYSEFSTMIPIAGSAYTYAYATMGEFLAWIIGWDLVLEYAVGASTVAVSWSGYVVSFLKDFGIVIPAQLTASPWEPLKLPGTDIKIEGIINLPAMFIIIAISLLLMIGIQESARANSIIVVIKVTVVIVFIVLGWSYINPKNYEPLRPQACAPSQVSRWVNSKSPARRPIRCKSSGAGAPTANGKRPTTHAYGSATIRPFTSSTSFSTSRAPSRRPTIRSRNS